MRPKRICFNRYRRCVYFHKFYLIFSGFDYVGLFHQSIEQRIWNVGFIVFCCYFSKRMQRFKWNRMELQRRQTCLRRPTNCNTMFDYTGDEEFMKWRNRLKCVMSMKMTWISEEDKNNKITKCVMMLLMFRIQNKQFNRLPNRFRCRWWWYSSFQMIQIHSLIGFPYR